MDKLVLHPATKLSLEQIRAKSPQAILLVGSIGSGKAHIAQVFGSTLLGSAGAAQAGLIKIQPEKGSIGIDAVRQAKKHLTLTMPGSGAIRRVIIIEDAGSMTQEAQNALLKALEEPPADAVFILTAQNGSQLLDTIASRVAQVPIRPLSQEMAREHFAAHGHSSDDIRRAYLLSGGGAGLMAALLEDVEHPLKAAIEDSKRLLTQKPFERLSYIDQLSKDTQRIQLLFEALQRVLRAAALAAVSKQSASVASATNRLRLVHKAQIDWRSNPNTKLLLTDLLLNL